MKNLRWLIMPFAAGILALAVACGGNDGDEANSANNSNGGGSASGGGDAVSQELNLSNAAAQLLELRSFRFDMALQMDFDLSGLEESGEAGDEFGEAFAGAFLALLSNVKMSGAYVAPDSFDMTMSLVGEEARLIQIGDEAWVNDGSGWVEADSSMGSLTPLGDPTDFATDFLPTEVLSNAKTSSEKVGGLDTTRYSFDKDALQSLAQEFGGETADFDQVEEMSLDVWIAEGNLPVKFAVKVTGRDPQGGDISIDMSFEITDINEDIEIERPI